MTALLAGRDASIGRDRAARYARHRPEQTLLDQIVEAHFPAFLAESVPFPRRFLLARAPQVTGSVLGIV